MNGLNRYGATLIQDTADFFYLAGTAIKQAHAEFARTSVGPGAYSLSLPCFYTWLFAHQIENVFGLSCKGHHRRQHPNVQIVDQIKNVIDLDAITMATIVVPKIYEEQDLEVDLWYDDLVIRYVQPNVFTMLTPASFQFSPDLKSGSTNNFKI